MLGVTMDQRLVNLSARLDDLIEFFDPDIFGRIPSIAGAGNVLKRGAASTAESVQKGYGSAVDAVRNKLAASGAARAQGRATAAAAQAKSGGIRDYFSRSSFDRPDVRPSTGPFNTMGGAAAPAAPAAAPAVAAAPAAASVPVAASPRPVVNPAVAPPTGGVAGMATGAPTQAAGAVAAANAAGQPVAQAGAAPWWKNKYVAGAGIAAGAGGAGYMYGSQRQQMSSWLDDIIHFERGKYISKNVIDPDPLIGEKLKAILKSAASKQGGKTRGDLRDLLAMAGRTKTAAKGLKAGPAVRKIFESAEEPIWFDNRPRNQMGQFQPQEGGPDPNAMATVYKQPGMQQGFGIGKTLAVGSALAVGGGALGHVGSEIGKAGVSKAKEILKRFRKK